MSALFLHRVECEMLAYALDLEQRYMALEERHIEENGLWGAAAEAFAELRDALVAFRYFPPSKDWYERQ